MILCRSFKDGTESRKKSAASFSPHLHQLISSRSVVNTNCSRYQNVEEMESTRRDLHSTTATLSSLLTKFAKLAAQASTSYSSSGVLSEDLGRVREEIEGEINAALDTVC